MVLRRTPARVGAVCLGLLTVLCLLHCLPARAAVTDRFPSIPNAFATTGFASTVRAVYEAHQLLTNTTGPVAAAARTTAANARLTPFRSSGYVLCQAQPATNDAGTNAIVAAWCGTNEKNGAYRGTYVTQSVNWSTLAPPGLQVLDVSAESYRARAWDCLSYACDTENTIHTTTRTAPAAVGGLSVATPCCGSTNSTFVLYNTRGIVVQASTLPVSALNVEALLLAEAHAAAVAAASSSSSASSPTVSTPAAPPDLSSVMRYCLIRQLLPSFTENNIVQQGVGSLGDGAVSLPVEVSVCGEDVSDRIDTRHATLAMRGYTLLLTTADGVEELSFPKELIDSIGSWVATGAGTASLRYGSAYSLSRSGGACAWHFNADYATAYRTGDYYECSVLDATLLEHLPPLLLSIRNESIVDTEETNSSCSIALDLTACAVAGGRVLRFFSTGSLTTELQQKENAMATFRDPPIVVGVHHLQGATVAVTRTAVISKWFSSDFNLASGLPLLYLAIPDATALAASTTDTALWDACVQPQTCLKRQIFYPSLNRCATKECLNVLLYSFNPDTFACSVRVSVVSLFAALCFGVFVAELVVLYLRRSTEEAKEEHMRLVHAVQRREAGTQ